MKNLLKQYHVKLHENLTIYSSENISLTVFFEK